MEKESGFTLIEIIASLVLVGFMTVFAGTGIVTFTKGYLFAKENAHMAQKANLAMARITRELQELLNVTSASNTDVTIKTTSGERTIGLDDGSIKIAELGTELADGDILVDDVAGFTLSYYQGATTWAQGIDDIQYLSAIEVVLNLNRADTGSGSIEFASIVHMRNNDNYGGAPPTSAPASQYSYCFIQTAASGDSAIPSARRRIFIFLTLFLYWAGLTAIAKKNFPTAVSRRLSKPKGSILVGLVVTMLIISSLGAAMLPLTASSTFTQVGANKAARAYLLAESGLRYVASEYLQAGNDTERNDTLESIHNHCAEDKDDKQYSLADDAGSFKVEIYPYYFITTSDPSGTNELNTKVPGGYPSGLDLSSGGWLKIGSDFHEYITASRIDQSVTFTMQNTMTSIPENKESYLVAISSSTSQEVSNGGALVVRTGTADVFPERNGTFRIDDHLYSYKENNTLTNKLIGIKDPNDPGMTSFTVGANSKIVLQKFVKVRSTGKYGLGDVASSRQLVYYVPLRTTEAEKVVYADLEEDSTTSSVGTQTVDDQTIPGRTVLKVSSAEDIGSGNVASVAALDTSTAEVNLEKVYQSADNTLSYDTQVKIGFDPSVPSTYMNGISFRLDALGNTANSYGVSFVLGGASDGIPDDFVPYDDYPMIVLWQQTSSGAVKNWIAYDHLTGPVFFYDDVESGTIGWTASGLWNITDHRSQSASNAWYYGQPGVWHYETGAIRNSGNLDSPSIQISSTASSAFLNFWTFHETEPSTNYDRKRVYISTDGGTTWPEPVLDQLIGNANTEWVFNTIDLSAYIGQTIKIRFSFDTIDGILNRYEGWYVDDIKIYQSFSIHDATILARIIEAPSISFKDGGAVINEGTIYEETLSIQDGDTITGAVSGASGTVDGNPIVSSGGWGDTDAAGTILLKDVSGTFDTSETLLLGLQEIATVNGNVSTQDNFIRVYYSDTSGYGTENSDAFDSERQGNPVGTENWPSDETTDWSADTDHFTMVQWDEKNAAVASAELLDSDSIEEDEPKAVIKSGEAELLSPSSGTFSKPELGLHAYGNSSDQVYFDDFAIQIEETVLYKVTPIQE
jgi:type II secretory pathway pseudopilin PulG